MRWGLARQQNEHSRQDPHVSPGTRPLADTSVVVSHSHWLAFDIREAVADVVVRETLRSGRLCTACCSATWSRVAESALGMAPQRLPSCDSGRATKRPLLALVNRHEGAELVNRASATSPRGAALPDRRRFVGAPRAFPRAASSSPARRAACSVGFEPGARFLLPTGCAQKAPAAL